MFTVSQKRAISALPQDLRRRTLAHLEKCSAPNPDAAALKAEGEAITRELHEFEGSLLVKDIFNEAPRASGTAAVWAALQKRAGIGEA